MLESLLWGGFLRGSEALLQASPFILTGLVVAGVFRRLFTPEGLRKLFGHGTWWCPAASLGDRDALAHLFARCDSGRPADAEGRNDRRNHPGVRLVGSAV